LIHAFKRTPLSKSVLKISKNGQTGTGIQQASFVHYFLTYRKTYKVKAVAKDVSLTLLRHPIRNMTAWGSVT
jgi:hypothetical protein